MTSRDNTQSPAAAAARKRRIELRNQQRNASITSDGGDDSLSETENKRPRVEDEPEVDPVPSDPKPSLTGIKLQHRYDPGVKMTREELKVWRKEARRVRNRESAAASRERNRERIAELEVEVDVLNSKYAAALQRIIQLEAAATNDSFTPMILRQDLKEMAASSVGDLRPTSPQNVVMEPMTVSPPLSPMNTMNRISRLDLCAEDSILKYHHIIEQISRPAVSI